jgi:hypothetical protein
MDYSVSNSPAKFHRCPIFGKQQSLPITCPATSINSKINYLIRQRVKMFLRVGFTSKRRCDCKTDRNTVSSSFSFSGIATCSIINFSTTRFAQSTNIQCGPVQLIPLEIRQANPDVATTVPTKPSCLLRA